MSIALEYRPTGTSYDVGDTVTVEVYAMSEDGPSEDHATIEILVYWDHTKLKLLGNHQVGVDPPYMIIGTGHWDQSGELSLINEADPPQDGDGWLSMHGMLYGYTYTATAAGTLVSTLEFEAIAEGSANIDIGDIKWITDVRPLSTQVFSATIPAWNLIGARRGCVIEIGASSPPVTCGDLIDGIRAIILASAGEPVTEIDNRIVAAAVAFNQGQP